jgi:hypothetical protein
MTSLVRDAVTPYEHVFLGRRALLGRHRCRRFRRFIDQHSCNDNRLLVVGKSLGARNLVSHVLNPLGNSLLMYRRVGLLTVDPCWPLWHDWAPNLNGEVLDLTAPVDRAINVFLDAPPDQQAGSLVAGAMNRQVEAIHDVDHGSMSTHPLAIYSLREILDFVVS